MMELGMATPTIWWKGDLRERFWLESTDRRDIGADLRAPLSDDSGSDNWRYTLFREAQVGDLVFHYDKRLAAIASVSRIAGPPTPAPIVWAARGSYARDRGAELAELPGYRMALDHHQALVEPVTLDRLRAAAPNIRALHDALRSRLGGPLYFPFELSDRPLRALQGYAFKLPADFVDAFPPLRRAVAASEVSLVASSAPDNRGVFRQAIVDIETAAPSYRMSRLQEMRTRRRGLLRTAKSIFGSRVQADDWAFHYGGRDELQFNIGIDEMPGGLPAFRAGVAFSFEPSRSLPDIGVLVPKVARFNAWMREHPEAFSKLAMWHYQGGRRSDDYAPGPIPPDRVRPDAFVFLGDRQPMPTVDPHTALRTMDGLLPLYEYVEAVDADVQESVPAESADNLETLRLDDGRIIEGGRWITASIPARTLDIFLRHAEIQRRLKAALLAEGCKRAATEVPVGLRSIDLVAEQSDGMWFYEVKTASSVRACLREAIGQLLEHALWPGSLRPTRLVVVGEQAMDDVSEKYLEALNAAFPIPLAYRQVSLSD
jgi:hypothetical protein